jgi:hypothetical protein
MSLSKEAIELITKLEAMEYERFVKVPDIGILHKTRKISDCFSEISSFISTHTNSIHIVFHHDQKVGIVVCNTNKIDDHTNNYHIILSSSAETFRVEEIHNNSIKTIVKDYETTD